MWGAESDAILDRMNRSTKRGKWIGVVERWSTGVSEPHHSTTPSLQWQLAYFAGAGFLPMAVSKSL